MSAERIPEDLSDDAALGGKLRLLQPRRGHRFGHDAILLAAATGAGAGEHAFDLGSGVGAAGLALAARVTGARVTLVEIDPALSALAAENIERNGMAGRMSAVTLDVAAAADVFTAAGLSAESADHFLMNPPFQDGASGTLPAEAGRRTAHVAAQDLSVWVTCAARLLRPGGTLTLIHRADALAKVLAALADPFGAHAVVPVYSKPDAAAIRILVRATKGRRGPLVLLPGFYFSGDDGRPSADVEQILRHGAAISFKAT